MQVLAALRDTDVPVPRALCLATDASIIGTPFYVMEHVQVCPRLPTGRHITLSPISNSPCRSTTTVYRQGARNTLQQGLRRWRPEEQDLKQATLMQSGLPYSLHNQACTSGGA